MPKTPARPLLLLDACCLINLLVTGRCEEILTHLAYRPATSRLIAEKEILSVSVSTASEGDRAREIISPARLESSEKLVLLELSGESALADFIRFAAELDDGEASICALAMAQGASVATDDRKALRLLSRVAPQIPTVQTPELLYDWAHRSRAPEREIVTVLRAVRDRARFHPRRDAPRFDWWASFSS